MGNYSALCVPLLLSVYSSHICCKQHSLTFQTDLFKFSKLSYIFDTWFWSPVEASIGLQLIFMEDFMLCGPKIIRDTNHPVEMTSACNYFPICWCLCHLKTVPAMIHIFFPVTGENIKKHQAKSRSLGDLTVGNPFGRWFFSINPVIW